MPAAFPAGALPEDEREDNVELTYWWATPLSLFESKMRGREARFAEEDEGAHADGADPQLVLMIIGRQMEREGIMTNLRRLQRALIANDDREEHRYYGLNGTLVVELRKYQGTEDGFINALRDGREPSYLERIILTLEELPTTTVNGAYSGVALIRYFQFMAKIFGWVIEVQRVMLSRVMLAQMNGDTMADKRLGLTVVLRDLAFNMVRPGANRDSDIYRYIPRRRHKTKSGVVDRNDIDLDQFHPAAWKRTLQYIFLS
jgi:hypothetical protein